MEIVTGDETGLLKLTELKGKSLVSTWGRQKRSCAPLSLSWCEYAAPPARGARAAASSAAAPAPLTVVASVTAAGNVEIWDPLSSALLHTVRNVGLGAIHLASHAASFVVVCAGGDVRVFPHTAKDADAEATCEVRRDARRTTRTDTAD